MKRRPIPSKKKRSKEAGRPRRAGRDFFEKKARKYGAIDIELEEEKELYEEDNFDR